MVIGSCNLRIGVDVEVPVLSHGRVAFLDAVPDPAAEDAAEDRSADVTDPFLGDLPDLLLVWHIRKDFLMAVVQEVADVLEPEALVLRDRDVPDVLCLDAYRLAMSLELKGPLLTSFPGSYKILQEVDADLLVSWKIIADVDRDEVVHLALGPKR